MTAGLGGGDGLLEQVAEGLGVHVSQSNTAFLWVKNYILAFGRFPAHALRHDQKIPRRLRLLLPVPLEIHRLDLAPSLDPGPLESGALFRPGSPCLRLPILGRRRGAGMSNAELADVLSGARRLGAPACRLPRRAADAGRAERGTRSRRTRRTRRRLTEGRRLKGKGEDGGPFRDEPVAFAPITEAERDWVGRSIASITARWALVFCQVEAAMLWRASLVVGTGFGYRRTCVWIKPDGQPQLTGDWPGCGYESIVACHRLGASRWNGGGKIGVFSHYREAATPDGGGVRIATSTPPRAAAFAHAELVSALHRPRRHRARPLRRQRHHGRRLPPPRAPFIGIEKDATYAQLARDRLTAEERGSTLQAQRAGQEPLFKVQA